VSEIVTQQKRREKMKNLLNRLFKREEKKVDYVTPARAPRVYVEFQWVGTRGRIGQKMDLALLKSYVENEVIYGDYEIIAYL
jgi:hypothetical protein